MTTLSSLALPAIAVLAAAIAMPLAAQQAEAEPQWSIAIHGGSGAMRRADMTEAQQAEYKAALQSALDAGARVLREGGSAVDAVKAAVVPLEDDPKFNAGRGAVFTWQGTNELDAAIMDGRDRSAGAVTGVTSIKNPILLAEAVRQDGRHVFLSREGAEEFARDHGLETAPPEWFATEPRRRSLERLKANQLSVADYGHKFGTVGAVALDRQGNLAAGTSTGGITGKRWGRIGDSPIIGAGTYADNRSCAVSATGAGEYFIRVGVAHEICVRMRIARQAASSAQIDSAQVKQIADDVLAEVRELGGEGGVIVVTPEGHAELAFNTEGMYRGRATSGGVNEVAIFVEE